MEQSWTRSTTSLFIKEVKKRPILWNKKLTPYLDKCDEDKAWGQIAKIMGWTATRCVFRWRNLKTAYQRQLKKLSTGVIEHPTASMRAMHFCLPFMKPDYCKAQLPLLEEEFGENNEVEYLEEEEINMQDSFESQLPSHITKSESPSFSFVSEFMPSSSQQVKQEEDSLSQSKTSSKDCNDIQLEISDMITNVELKNDAKKMFLLSLLPDVYAMTDAQMRKFKREVLNLVGNIFDCES